MIMFLAGLILGVMVGAGLCGICALGWFGSAGASEINPPPRNRAAGGYQPMGSATGVPPRDPYGKT